MQPSLRENILNAGLSVMFSAGYVGATVRDICKAANAPHGSFTNHFGSKEQFAREVLERYFTNLQLRVEKALGDTTITPRQRLWRYLEMTAEVLQNENWSRGCLIGDFSIEASSISSLIRTRLQSIFEEWRAPFAVCIAEAQSIGEIDATFDATELADFLLASWEGAILRMKVEHGPAPLDRFRKIIFQTVFKEKQ